MLEILPLDFPKFLQNFPFPCLPLQIHSPFQLFPENSPFLAGIFCLIYLKIHNTRARKISSTYQSSILKRPPALDPIVLLRARVEEDSHHSIHQFLTLAEKIRVSI